MSHMCKIDQNFNFLCSFIVVVVFVIVIVVDLAFLVFDGILI